MSTKPKEKESTPGTSAERERSVSLSFAQEGLWFLDKINAGVDSYRVTLLMRFDGRLDIGVLQRTLSEVTRRHEVFRTLFPERDGRPVAVVSEACHVALAQAHVPVQTESGRDRELDRLIEEELEIPFDLTNGPLWRGRLIDFGQHVHGLILMFHHIVMDGWSAGKLYQEICEIYAALAQGKPSPLPEPPQQYADFAAGERQRLQEPLLQQQLAYWRRNLEGAPVLALPRDRPQALLSSFKAISEERLLPRSLSESLRQFSRRQGVTLFVTMLAAFEVLLHRYSGQDDIVIGTPVMTRNRPELESMIGLLVNMVALRLDLADDPPFHECLRRVRRMVLEANDHAEVPFEKIVQAVQPERVASRNPIFQVAFALDMGYQPVLANRRELPDLTISPVHKNDVLTHLEMEMYLRNTGTDIAVLMVCGKDLFVEATVTRMLDHYERILEAVVADPAQRISQMTLLSPTERRQLLEEWNDTRTDYPRAANVVTRFEEQVRRAPDALAVASGDRRISYRALNEQANRLAHDLIGRGVGPDVPVAVLMERTPEMVAAQLAILKAGGAYVPIDPEYPAARVEFILRDTMTPVVITQTSLAGLAPDYAGHRLCVDAEGQRHGARDARNPDVRTRPDDLAYVIYTSGSTGEPKGVEVSHRGLWNLVSWHCRAYQVEPADRASHLAGLGFDASVWELWPTLAAGASIHLVPDEQRYAPAALWGWLAAHGITLAFLPTPLAEAALRERVPEGLRLRVLLTGGDRLHGGLCQKAVPFRLVNHYGPTENSVVATCAEVDPQAVGEPPIGRPIDNVRTYVLDERLQPVPTGVAGELYVGGESLARGYLNRPQLTAEKFVADPFRPGERLYRTGDAVRWRADGALEFIGRIDQQVKLRGFRIELGEIEAVLGRQPGVDAAVVAAREDTPGNKRLVAYVVPAAGQSPSVDALRAALQDQLPAYMVPAAIVVLQELPLTSNGKVDRAALPDPAMERSVGTAYVSPSPGPEAEIAAIWKEVLNLDVVGVEDNFFDLGGHSLLLVQVHDKLKQLAGRELPIATLFQFPTVRALAGYLGRRDVTPASPDALASQPEPTAPGTANGYHLEPIAVVGMAGRFPGARNVDEFWRNLCAGVESVRFFSEQELREAGCDPRLISRPDYVPAKGYLEDADLFDAQFFGYSPREAELMDPQQRLFLECAWEALETAGYDPERYAGQIGVYAGSSLNTYQLRLQTPLDGMPLAGGLQGIISNDKDFLPTRVSYKLNLRGPSVNVQTACSTSLVAVHQACRSLLTDECDMALAGGVSVTAPLVAGYQYESGSIASPDGHCRAFDAAAQGTVSGNGVGVVVLKRLSRALTDGDVIHAVIRGSAINNDGSVKVGYTAPSVEGQSQAVARALALSGAEPASVSYIETHGTGTPLGDPIEIAALKQVFRDRDAKQPIALGSVKSNFGHLDAAAGIAGFIKTALMLEHKQLPPSLHFESPNPELHLEQSPFYVSTHLTDWPAGATPRRAGVSSFGIGGTNAHVVLEEAPALPPSAAFRAPQLLMLSARTPSALDRMSDNLAAALERRPDLNLADVAYTLQTGRKRFKHARIIVCRETGQAMAALRQRSARDVFTGVRESGDRPVAFMFPGQGSQHINMARGLYETEPRFRGLVDECAEQLRADLDADLRDILYPPADRDADQASQMLTLTRFAQPALFVIEYALARLWMQWGIKPVAMIGHSLGEYVAACIAGVMPLHAALRLVALRARLMSELPGGKMLAVPLATTALQPLLDEQVSIASINGPGLTVISGPEQSLSRVQTRLVAQGVEARWLHTSHAFHSSMMEPVLQAFTGHVASIPLDAPKIPYLSNVTGDWITPEQATDPDYYARHLRQTVLFSSGLERLFARPDWILLEVGPGQTMSTLAKRHPGKPAPQVLLTSARHPDQVVADETFILETLGRLWIAGGSPDWPALHGGHRQRVVLPTYPFERQRFWIESDRTAGPSAKLLRKADPAEWAYVPSWRRVPVRTRETDQRAKIWLCFSDPLGFGAHLEAALHAHGATTVSVVIGERFAKLDERRYAMNPALADDYVRLLGELSQSSLLPHDIVHLWSVTAGDVPPASDARGASGFYSLLYLAQALEGHAATAPIGVVVVTNQVHDVDGQEQISPEQAMVLGACKVIGMENPDLHLRCIDVVLNTVGTDWQRLARMLTADVCADPKEPVVAYRGWHRWVQTFEPIVVDSTADSSAGLRQSGVYLIVGGLGAIGLELARYLARRATARLVLVARGAMPERSRWDAWLREHADSDPVSRKIRKLRHIEALGAEVMLSQADAADEQQLAAAVAAGEARFGPLHGVIYAAGAEKRLTPFIALDHTACDEQFRPKLQGLRALERVLEGKRLDFCVVNSSLASVMGVVGGAAYTAAHVFSDAFVHRHNHRSDVRWIAINWDNWDTADNWDGTDNAGPDGARASASSPALTKFHMPAHDATELFGRLLTDPCAAQFLISTGDLQGRIDQWISQRAGNAERAWEAAAPAHAASAHPRPSLSVEYAEPRTATESRLMEIWCSVLGIDRIGIHDNFFELGGDSILNIQITARASQVGLKLSPKQIFEHPTIAELAAVVGLEREDEAEQGIVTGPVPLTPIQQWFFERHAEHPHHFNLPMLLEVRQPLDRTVLEQSLQRLATQHDALRLRYYREGDAWQQRIVATGEPAALHWYDLGAETQEEQVRQIEAHGTRLQQSLDIADGPLMQAAYFDLGPRQAPRLLLVMHHLIVDIVSWRILLEDLQSCYLALAGGREPSLPRKTASVKRWAETLANYAQSPQAEAELDFWRAVGADADGEFPVDSREGRNTNESAATIVAELSVEHTRSLITDIPRIFSAGASDTLLLALARAVAPLTGHGALFVDLEGHGRDVLQEGADPSRTVGWFTTLYPVLLRVPDGSDLEAQLASVREQYRTIPNHGMGYGMLRYLSKRAEVRDLFKHLPRAPISFLYTGQSDQAFPADALFVPATGAIGPARAPNGERTHLLEVNCGIARGRFWIGWTYSRNRHRAGTIQTLAEAFMQNLRALIEQARHRNASADVTAVFTAADIKADDLAEILSQQGT